jgi:Gamma-glutamylcysteine synthetase
MQLLLGWEPIMERGNIIGLYDVTGGGAISLEPGGSSNCPARRSRPCTRPSRADGASGAGARDREPRSASAFSGSA